MSTETNPSRQAGFSLIEMLVAVVITLIVSSAVYGLMTAGQGAFAREPQLTDRQQNARIAMDLIETDVINAGRGLPLVAQAFVDLLDGVGPNGTDELELVMADACPSHIVCDGAAGTFPAASTIVTREPTLPNGCLTPAAGGPGLVLLAGTLRFSVHANVGTGGGDCAGGGGAANGTVTIGAALPGLGSPPGGPLSWGGPLPANVTLYPARVIHYRIGVPDALGVTSLERSENGAAGPFQVVARGIDNLDVQYMTGVPGPLPGGWSDVPGAVAACAAGCTPAEYAAVVRNVRLTVGARTVSPVQGQVPFRGDYTTVVTPRAAVVTLEMSNAVN